jgi:hypothetical protein
MAILTDTGSCVLLGQGRERRPLRFHAYGNNAAVECPDCQHPILLTARPGWPGSESRHAHCPNKKCRLEVWMTSTVEPGEPVDELELRCQPPAEPHP